MLPDIEGKQRLQALGERVVGVRLLGDDEGAVGGGGEPDPAGAEEGGTFGDEVSLEGGEGAPLFHNLSLEMPGRAGHDGRSRLELREVQVMIQNLAGVVEDGAVSGKDDFFQGLRLKLSAGDKAVEVVDIALEVLAVVEADGVGADDRCQGIGGVREVD